MKSLIFSSYTNAYAIFRGAEDLGIEVVTTDSNATFPIPSEPFALKGQWLFFTEEASLRRALLGGVDGFFFPCHFPLNLLDDKWALVNWLDQKDGLAKGLRQWSLWEKNEVTYPCLLKAKHSWAEEKKLPRGWVCRSPQELAGHLASLEKDGYQQAHFFLQEWLGDGYCRVISVCGFHDSLNSHRNLTAVVERIASHTEGLSCSAAVQTIIDEWNLISKTSAILTALNFTGPYEMEYLVVGGKAMVLELNPRFWMQNAIFLKSGNGLIKRYLGMDSARDHEINTIDNVVWLDGIHLITSLAQFKFAFLVFVVRQFFKKKAKVILWPSLPMAMRVVGRMAWRRFVKKCRTD